MSVRTNTKTLLMAFGAAMALAGCGNGADSVVSPGAGAFPPAPPPPVAPPPPPPPTTPPPASGPAASCPAGLTNVGTVASGTLRACRLPNEINQSLALARIPGLVYQIAGAVTVGTDAGGDANNPVAGAARAVLSIDPGVTLYGAAPSDYLLVNRGSQLVAVGTKDQPITFTSRQSLEGQTTADSQGQWGSVILLGRAPINNCNSQVTPGSATCQALIEGVNNAYYGGSSNTDSSGQMRYVRILYSGYEVSPGNELQALTLGGVGNGTELEYIQTHNSADDGIEIFGGSANLKRIVLTGADDDSLDIDTGWSGGAQYVIAIQRAGTGDKLLEWSSVNRTPFSTPKLANATLIGNARSGWGIEINQGTNAGIFNTVVTRPAGGTGNGDKCLNVTGTGSVGTFHSVFFSCPVPFVAGSTAEANFNAGTNNTARGTSSLTATFINGANEAAVAPYANLKSVHSFFDNTSYIGAVKDANDTWWQGWTCNLTADKPC